MSRQKQFVQEIPRSDNIEVITERVRKDLAWVLVGILVAVSSGLAVGNFFKF